MPSMIHKFALLLVSTVFSQNICNDIILASSLRARSGSDLCNDKCLNEIYETATIYANEKIITTSANNLYYIDHNGQIATRTLNGSITAAEQYVAKYRQLNLLLYPGLWCEYEEREGVCEELEIRLLKTFEHKEEFIRSTIEIADRNGWDGYTVSFSVSKQFNVSQLLEFVVDWGNALRDTKRSLKIYVEGVGLQWFRIAGQPYADSIDVIGYVPADDYDEFVSWTKEYFRMINRPDRMIITLDYLRRIDDEVIKQIVNWSISNNVKTFTLYLDMANILPSSLFDTIRNFTVCSDPRHKITPISIY